MKNYKSIRYAESFKFKYLKSISNRSLGIIIPFLDGLNMIYKIDSDKTCQFISIKDSYILNTFVEVGKIQEISDNYYIIHISHTSKFKMNGLFLVDGYDGLEEFFIDIKRELPHTLIIPSRFIYHASHPNNRERILEKGIEKYRGKQWIGDSPIKSDAVFATNSSLPTDWFDSTFDDDIWRIDAYGIDIEWFKDPHYNENYHHIYTLNSIPINLVTLVRVGTGKDMMLG